MKKQEPRNYLINLKRIEEATRRGRNVLENILTFSGKLRPSYSPVKINDLIFDVFEEVWELEKCFLASCGLEFTIECGAGIPMFMGDSPSLEQVLSNLLLNAIEAIRRKNESCNNWIRIRSFSGNGQIGVIVQDNGCGIPEESLNRLSDPSFNAEERGTGLILAVSYCIIKILGGTIEAESTEYEGSTFTITLPLENGERTKKNECRPNKREKLLKLSTLCRAAERKKCPPRQNFYMASSRGFCGKNAHYAGNTGKRITGKRHLYNQEDSLQWQTL